MHAARAGTLTIHQLSEEDRCWVVAQLTARGETTDDIRHRLKCGVRLIKYIRAKPLTQMIERWLIADAEAGAHRSRVEVLEHYCATTLTECEQGTARVKTQLSDLVAQNQVWRQRFAQESQRVTLYRKYLGAPPRPNRVRQTPDQLALF
ncbi:hypothetical protein [Mycobacterium sp. NS-7484]|uniref:hypothetical protein n=1 Tax=Mycobacterium sp. NS-7484 TaxID=1834161 RepID=UPI0013017AB4|nr:hypothetical protein [Mycobacterium sp. NS-7484]